MLIKQPHSPPKLSINCVDWINECPLIYDRKRQIKDKYLMHCFITIKAQTWIKLALHLRACKINSKYIKELNGVSLVAQWLRIHLPMQGTRVRALVQEDPTCHRATKPVCHNYWSPHTTTTEACMPRAGALQQEKPLQWEACALQRRVAPARHNLRKPTHSNKDPTQPKILKNKINKIIWPFKKRIKW